MGEVKRCRACIDMAAWGISGQEPDVIEVSEAEYVAAKESRGYFPDDHMDPEDVLQVAGRNRIDSHKRIASAQDAPPPAAPTAPEAAATHRPGGSTSAAGAQLQREAKTPEFKKWFGESQDRNPRWPAAGSVPRDSRRLRSV